MTSATDGTNVTGGIDALSLRPMTCSAHDLEQFQACFARNNPRPRSLASLEWQYLANTTPHLFVDLATADSGSRIAAIYASLPGWMRIDGHRRLALQSLDTLTDADFRGKGLFVTLAKQTFARASAEGAALIYGFPNGNSAHGFFKKLGWTPLDPVPFLIRPLRASYAADRLKLGPLARRLVPSFPLVLGGQSRRRDVVELHRADDRLTRLWHRFGERTPVALDRDAAFFQWRIFDKPGENYRVFAVEDGSELVAACIHCVKEKHGGRIGYVMELLHDLSARGWRGASHLLGRAVRSMADEGADSVLSWAFRHSPNFTVYARRGFFPLPERLRPIELHFGARAFDPQLEPTIRRRESWYLSYLDSDTV